MSAKNNVLSILIPSIPERIEKFTGLKREIMTQINYIYEVHPALGSVQVVTNLSKSFKDGGPSIGRKRQTLIERASGKYLCFLDDDESVAPNYVETILRLIYDDDPDVVCFRSIAKMDNFWTIIDMSLKNKENEQATPDNIVNRLPWHICPVRSEFAKKEIFNDSNYGEDWQWFERVLKLCKMEVKSNAVIHQYNHSNKHSMADNVTTSIG